MSWPLAGQMDLDVLHGHFQPKQFCFSMISVRYDINRTVCSLKLPHFLEKLFSSVLFHIIYSKKSILAVFSPAQADIKLKRNMEKDRFWFNLWADHSLARLS